MIFPLRIILDGVFIFYASKKFQLYPKLNFLDLIKNSHAFIMGKK